MSSAALHLFEKGFERVRGAADDEADAALGRVLRRVAQALLQEVVVAQVGVGVVGNHAEVDDHRQAEKVGGFDGDVERGIVDDAQGALHPVDDAGAVLARRAGAAHQDAGLIGEGGEFGGDLCGVGCGHHVFHLPQSDQASYFTGGLPRAVDAKSVGHSNDSCLMLARLKVPCEANSGPPAGGPQLVPSFPCSLLSTTVPRRG